MAAAVCSSICVALEDCFTVFSRDDCQRGCEADSTDGLLSDSVLRGLARCYRTQSCAALESGGADSECFERAVADLEPSAQCVAFCEQEVLDAFECGGGYAIDDCLNTSCTWSDAVLSEATDCIQADCDETFDCQTAAFSGP